MEEVVQELDLEGRGPLCLSSVFFPPTSPCSVSLQDKTCSQLSSPSHAQGEASGQGPLPVRSRAAERPGGTTPECAVPL